MQKTAIFLPLSNKCYMQLTGTYSTYCSDMRVHVIILITGTSRYACMHTCTHVSYIHSTYGTVRRLFEINLLIMLDDKLEKKIPGRQDAQCGLLLCNVV